MRPKKWMCLFLKGDKNGIREAVTPFTQHNKVLSAGLKGSGLKTSVPLLKQEGFDIYHKLKFQMWLKEG